ncbi:alpha/beta hydrolase [Tropicimonas marinistellae]|uniref:alpha/beta hydrolase n=1 Tax=Tropicimonas marinistellae TaxID=1739787 RepID=UPI000832CB7A|nr:alpha/beta fold hydrolase [Tropicimonas marinistellae]
MNRRRSLCVAALCGVTFAACTPRADITPVAARSDDGERIEILAGTTRAKTPDGLFHPSERGELSFARFDVSVPLSHEPGLVEIARGGRDPAREFAVTRIDHYANHQSFRHALADRLRSTPEAQGEVVVFIHGFNNTFGDSVFRTAQMANDIGFTAVPVSYSWPSRGHPLRYAYDRDSALFARDGLKNLLEEITRAGATTIILVAHSMGSQLTMETLRQMALEGKGPVWDRIGGIALMSPDIDVDVFRAQVADVGTLPERFVITTSSRDRALKLSARLTGQTSRLGNIPTADPVSDLNVTVVNATQLVDVDNSHMGVVTSPTFLSIMQNVESMNDAFQAADSGRAGLISGTVLTVQNATEIIMEPVTAISETVN